MSRVMSVSSRRRTREMQINEQHGLQLVFDALSLTSTQNPVIARKHRANMVLYQENRRRLRICCEMSESCRCLLALVTPVNELHR